MHPVSGGDCTSCQHVSVSHEVPHEVPYEETLKYVPQSSHGLAPVNTIHAYATTHKLPSEAVYSQYGVWKLMVSEEVYMYL